MSVGAVYRAAVEMDFFNTVSFVNTFHFRETAASPGHSAQDLADDLQAFLNTNMRPMVSVNVHFARVTAQRLVPNVEDVFEHIWSPIVAGTDTGGSGDTPSPIACLVTLRTALNSRRSRGRFFVGGLRHYQLDPTQFSSTATGKVNTFWTALMARYKSGGSPGHYEVGVWSRKNAGTSPPFSSAAFTAVTVFEIDPFYRVQRRREA